MHTHRWCQHLVRVFGQIEVYILLYCLSNYTQVILCTITLRVYFTVLKSITHSAYVINLIYCSVLEIYPGVCVCVCVCVCVRECVRVCVCVMGWGGGVVF